MSDTMSADRSSRQIALPVKKTALFGIRVSPLNLRRIENFKRNRRGRWSLWIFTALFLGTLPAEFIANDRPLIIWHQGSIYTPVLKTYAETVFGGDFETEAEYREPDVKDLIEKKGGWMIWPLIEYSYNTVNLNLKVPAPAPPSLDNVLGTDDQGRDVLARIIYGFRISVLFGLILTVFGSFIGIIAGAFQGFFGGLLDLLFQRFIEIWGGLPQLYILIILSSVIIPGFWTLLLILLLFGWTSLVGVVRAEFLRARNFEFVRAARALGAGNLAIMFRHVLPNALVATLTFLPLILTGSITSLTALDFLGLGLPPGSPSLGELLQQGKTNLQAPWLGLTSTIAISLTLILLIFVGEAVRDAFDPRKTFNG
ncbi:MAG: Inner membrane ABC transporter permease protein YejE [Alphaproteobacteria bacterium MarineAlpha11_Bin1]|nr:MAG: Inner membrane ABC transporter permease protein YejE [Alphaproteobacteria bacterium MarineAlpha11_Bin1]|tara:strand:+ start:9854 stop:10960 length:1107 start_codon:yes stop_codon:yes gene_type:complete